MDTSRSLTVTRRTTSHAVPIRNSDSKLRMKMKRKEAVKSFTHDEFMAAAIGDTAWLKQSLKDGRDPSKFDRNGLAALHLAALHGRLECLQFLVESCDVDVNLPSSTGWRAIHLAINSRTGKRGMDCLQYLLGRRADPSVLNDDQMTPSHQAAIEGSAKCLEALIAAGADINLKDSKGHTPLDYAKIWGHRICARLLASEGWRKDKEIQAQEMKILSKLKADDISQQEAREAEKKFYGSISFSNWLEDKGLPREPTGPETVSECHHAERKGRVKSIPGEKLHEPNSKRKPAVSKSPRVRLALPQTESNRTITPAKGAGARSKKLNMGTKEGALTVNSKRVDIGTSQEVKGIRDLLNELKPSSRLSGRRSSDSEEIISELPQYEIDRLWLERMSVHDRPLDFRCRNIIDAQHRKLYDESQKPLVETYAHISDCVESALFPRPKVRDGDRQGSGIPSYDVERMRNAFKSWTQPGRFPDIKGTDYTYGFEAH